MMWQVQLVTSDGRRFLLARHGWSYAAYNGEVLTFPTRAAANAARCRAYKCSGDKTTLVKKIS